ncbi:amino acid ABC transporter substrate-binding protein [Pararhizobium mangrovi]|uniref:Amino acid ABC transporter substrate-binding protein n=1 Tax=Pararhizobium mangrovi TaxID=2590452 RepID=A0A506TY63_9HYPH|nr:amino acid ABC transporter substrate-binding protein [Pararhizobium mangrovi]TPW26440.1 amino acid ABC transporter substrate-binding protein [Pararhizobium mangrovi]
MKTWKILAAVAATQFVAALGAHAASLEQVKKSGELRIGTEGTYAPFTYHTDSGKLTGFDVDIGRAIAKRLGVEAKFVEGRWDGLIAGIDAGRYDAVINEVGITPERQNKYDFSTPYIASKAVLIVGESNDTIKSFADLKGKKAAQTLTSNFGKLAEKNGADLVPTNSFDQSIQLVISGRADATVNDSLSYLDFKKHQPKAPVKRVVEEANAEQSGVLIAKGEPKLLDAIDKALADMKKDGTYLKISKKYFGEDVSK